ncbi:MAG: cupin domain-containing protein [Gemmatimonadales bacterium]
MWDHHVGNLLGDGPLDMADELVEVLAQGNGVRIERIVSRGHRSPDDFWYDQEQDEWVIVLSGSAKLALDDGSTVTLGPGDYVDIPAHTKHRIEYTDGHGDTVWLAVFYERAASE